MASPLNLKSESGACPIILLLLLLFTFSLPGCKKAKSGPKVTNGYGKSAGVEYASSVNGTGVFKQMFRQVGCSVKTSQSISPRIDKFQTIVWFRDRFEPPEDKVIQRLEEWLDSGYQHQLIIVGRDHDSGISYWEEVVNRAKGESLIKAKRRLAQSKAEFHSRRMEANLSECYWYDSKQNDYQEATRLEGSWAKGINVSSADIHTGIALVPKISYRGYSNSGIVLKANGQPLVSIFSTSSVVLVSNASFLTNYGIVNQENRKLAMKIIERQDPGDTLFIESGTDPVKMFNSEQNHETWAWITKPPLKYIVPHFLMVGVFFCFVLYPIFGRPKRVDTSLDNTTFRTHIRAMAKLISRSGRRDLAQQKIDRYNNRQ